MARHLSGTRITSRLSLGLALLLALAAIILAKPSRAASHDAYSNGCGGHGITGLGWAIPDRPLGFNFHPACDIHDRCYGLRPYGSSSAARLRCDQEFLGNLASICYRSTSGQLRVTCNSIALTYYNAVRAYGHF